MPGPDIDAELILVTARIWQALGIDGLELQINTLGTAEERAAYRDELVAYFEAHADVLDDDSRRRLGSNPLRILDSKNPEMREMLDGAPTLTAHLGDESRQHFDFICETRPGGCGVCQFSLGARSGLLFAHRFRMDHR